MGPGVSQPLVRVLLYPFVESASVGPGQRACSLRFGLWAAWRPLPLPGEGQDLPYRVRLALIQPDLPYSVLPHSVRQGVTVTLPAESEARWGSQPSPLWRGVPCRLGVVPFHMINELDRETPAEFELLVLLPERDPAGPRPEHILLGSEFLMHYGLRFTVDCGALQFVEDEENPGRRVDSRVPCGYLEKE